MMYLDTNNTTLILDIVISTPSSGNGTGHFLNNTGGPHSLPTPFSLAESIVIGIILSLIILGAISGNLLVVVAILTDRNLRKVSNYFIISLAIADMLVASLVMTFAIANDLQGYWIFGTKFCSVWISFDIMCSTSSILNLCAISLDRYIHIKRPLHYDTWMSHRRALLLIATVWVLSALISFLPIHLGWHNIDWGIGKQSNETGPISVTPTLPSDYHSCVLDLNPIYAVISSLVSFYVPCFVMILIYFRLYSFAQKHLRSIKKHVSTLSNFNGIDSNHKNNVYKPSDHKAQVTLGIIMGVFLLCWMPFFTINIILAFCTDCVSPLIFGILTWLGYANSCLNPIIYGIFNQEFRNAFKRVLTSARCCQTDTFDSPYNGKASNYGTVKFRKSERKKMLTEDITAV